MKCGIAMTTVASLEATIEEQAEEIADLLNKLAVAVASVEAVVDTANDLRRMIVECEHERDRARALLADVRRATGYASGHGTISVKLIGWVEVRGGNA